MRAKINKKKQRSINTQLQGGTSAEKGLKRNNNKKYQNTNYNNNPSRRFQSI